MKKLAMTVSLSLFVACSAWAQSSGSFAYGTGNSFTGDTACTLLSNGKLHGGQQCIVSSLGTGADTTTPCPAAPATCAGLVGGNSTCDLATGFCTESTLFSCTTNSDCTAIYGSNSGATCVSGSCQLPTSPNGANDCIGNAQASVKTNSGSGNVLDIRTSAVVGLLTDVTISSKQSSTLSSSSSLAGIDFTMSVTGQGVPNPSLTPNETVTFDARFVQISSNLFAGLTATCTAATGGCFITFAESTVSAHSFEWVAGSRPEGQTLQSGEYSIEASWAPSTGFAVSGIGEAAACVGPVILTVTQAKIFHFNEVNQL
jgi:hypothetical protein